MIISVTFFSRALGTLKFDTSHWSCCIVGIACGGSTSGLKYPFSVKSNAMPASLLNRTSRRTILSSLVRLSPSLSFSILSGVNRQPLSILENLGINHGYWEPLLLLSSLLYTANCSFHFPTPFGLSPSLCGLFTGFTLSFFLLYKGFISPYEFNDRLSSSLTDTLCKYQRRLHTYFGLYTRATEESCLLHRCSRVHRREKERKGRIGRIERKGRIGGGINCGRCIIVLSRT